MPLNKVEVNRGNILPVGPIVPCLLRSIPTLNLQVTPHSKCTALLLHLGPQATLNSKEAIIPHTVLLRMSRLITGLVLPRLMAAVGARHSLSSA